MTTSHFLLLCASKFVITDSSSQLLRISDVELKMSSNREEYMALHVKQSKTDQERRGILLYTGHSKHTVCAVCAMKSNVQQQRAYHSHDGPLFGLSSGRAMTRKQLTDFVSSILRLLGMDPNLHSGHSFGIDGATAASVAGLKDYEIKLIGRWSSDCYKRYIRSPVSLFT